MLSSSFASSMPGESSGRPRNEYTDSNEGGFLSSSAGQYSRRWHHGGTHDELHKDRFWIRLGDTTASGITRNDTTTSSWKLPTHHHQDSQSNSSKEIAEITALEQPDKAELYYNKATGEMKMFPKSQPPAWYERTQGTTPRISASPSLSAHRSLDEDEHGFNWRPAERHSPGSKSSADSEKCNNRRYRFRAQRKTVEDPLDWSEETCRKEANRVRNSKFAVEELMAEVFYPFLDEHTTEQSSLQHTQEQLDLLALSFLRDRQNMPRSNHMNYSWLPSYVGTEILPVEDSGKHSTNGKLHTDPKHWKFKYSCDTSELKRAYESLSEGLWAKHGNASDDPALLSQRKERKFRYRSIIFSNNEDGESKFDLSVGGREYRIRNEAATKIQAVFRGKSVRDHLPALRHKAFRRHWQRKAAYMIQKVWRRYYANKQLMRLKKERENQKRKQEEMKRLKENEIKKRAEQVFEQRCKEQERQRFARLTGAIVAHQRYQKLQSEDTNSAHETDGKVPADHTHLVYANKKLGHSGDLGSADLQHEHLGKQSRYLGSAGLQQAAQKVQKFFRYALQKIHCQKMWRDDEKSDKRKIVDWTCSLDDYHTMNTDDPYLHELIEGCIPAFDRWVTATKTQKERCDKLAFHEANVTYHNLQIYKLKQLQLIRSWYHNLKSRFVTLFRMTDVSGEGVVSSTDILDLIRQSGVSCDLVRDPQLQLSFKNDVGFNDAISQEEFLGKMFTVEHSYFFEWLRKFFIDDSLVPLSSYLERYYKEKQSSVDSNGSKRRQAETNKSYDEYDDSSVNHLVAHATMQSRLERLLEGEASQRMYDADRTDHSDISGDSLEVSASMADVVNVTSLP